MSHIYIVHEYSKPVYKTDNFDHALHEMLSVILARNNSAIDDLYITEQQELTGKRFEYILNTFRYSNNNVVDKYDRVKHSGDDICNELLQQISLNRSFNTPKAFGINLNQNQNLNNNVNNDRFPVKTDFTSLLNKTVSDFGDLKQRDVKPLIPQMNIEKELIKKDTKITVNDDEESALSYDSNVGPDEILEQIEKLKQIKETGEQYLSDIKDEHEKQCDNHVDYVSDVNYKKKMSYVEKEREEERRKKFFADKKAYLLMKKDKVLEEQIPDFFIERFKIFKFLDDKGILETDIKYDDDDDDNDSVHDVKDEAEEYVMFNGLLRPNKEKSGKEKYIPHNYQYLPEEDKKLYDQYVNEAQMDDLLEEFMNKHVKDKSLNDKSMTEILDELDNEDSDVEAVVNINNVNNNQQLKDALESYNEVGYTSSNDDEDDDGEYDVNRMRNTVDKIRGMFE
jgi:hypothetical protein